MKLYHLLLLVWLLVFTVWALQQSQAAARRREQQKKQGH